MKHIFSFTISHKLAQALICLCFLLQANYSLVQAGNVSADSAESSEEDEEEQHSASPAGAPSAVPVATPAPSGEESTGATQSSPAIAPPPQQSPAAPAGTPEVATPPATIEQPIKASPAAASATPPAPVKKPAVNTGTKAPAPVITGMRPIPNINYAGTKLASQTMDIYQPVGVTKPTPVVVWIHGGSWLGGSKNDCRANFLVTAGFTTVSINYRLSTEAPFPAQIVDCKMAILYLRKHAKELNIDPSRIGVWGASAGGHLAALLGTTGDSSSWDKELKKVGASAKVQAVCDWCGPSDLREMNRKLATKEVTKAQVEPIFKLLANRCTAEWLAAASPVTFATPGAPPFLIMHGDKDSTVPVDQSRYLHNLLKSKNVDSTLYVLRGAGHTFESPINARIVLEFFKRTLQS